MKKFCNTCETEKDASEFGKRKASKDGLAAKCKACQKAYDKFRANDPSRKLQRAIYAQSEEGRIACNKAKAEWRKRNPNKYKAHVIVNNAIRDKKLFKEPCCECGKEDTHAHHDDYAKPLNIRWLCPACHKKWHAEHGEAKNP